jgi:alternate signal-mediated exported protein
MTETVDNTKKKGPSKLVKGSIAAAAGVALLLGGAGTFALWQQASNLGTTGTITAGHLRFGDVPEGTWTLTSQGGTQIVSDADLGALRLVPGDRLTYEVIGVPIEAAGDNLVAELGIDWGGVAPGEGPGDNAGFHQNLDVRWNVNGAASEAHTVTFPIDVNTATPQIIEKDIEIEFTFDPATTGVVGQDGVVNLSGFRLVLDQLPAA